MQTAPLALYADTHPQDLISRAKDKLELFNSLLNSCEDGGEINLSHPIISNGIYWLLDSISDELALALKKLQEKTA